MLQCSNKIPSSAGPFFAPFGGANGAILIPLKSPAFLSRPAPPMYEGG